MTRRRAARSRISPPRASRTTARITRGGGGPIGPASMRARARAGASYAPAACGSTRRRVLAHLTLEAALGDTVPTGTMVLRTRGSDGALPVHDQLGRGDALRGSGVAGRLLPLPPRLLPPRRDHRARPDLRTALGPGASQGYQLPRHQDGDRTAGRLTRNGFFW